VLTVFAKENKTSSECRATSQTVCAVEKNREKMTRGEPIGKEGRLFLSDSCAAFAEML